MKPIAVQDLAAADASLKAAQLPWFDSLTTDEKRALANYKGSAGRLMNQTLRGESEDPGASIQATRLQRALTRAKAPADLYLYRGIGPEEVALYRALDAGVTMQAPAFVSTSLALYVALDIARRKGGMAVEVLVQKGRRGVAYVHPFPTYQYKQFEVLLNAGSVLKVLQADDVVIRLEVGDDDGNE